ncbi:MAG TPA: hypothetical protein VM939_02720 [Gemmatimonadaceae bacterium]|nr:hypothetical protein [Gemmatimonadaceae bacterium]
MCRLKNWFFLFIVASVAQPLRAQPILLQIKPRIGDTLSVRLNQQVEMTGTPTGCVPADSSRRRNTTTAPRLRPCSEGPRHMTTKMEVFSRAIIKRSSPEGTFVLAVTDSIRTASGAQAKTTPPSRINAPNHVVELRIATDGGAEVVDAAATEELRTIFGQMPATLSRKPVSPGERWMREMRIPLSAEPGGTGLVRTNFQLDSLGRDGDVAYISMRGTLYHDHKDGSGSEMSGQLIGSMQFDRRLAWITDMRVTITTESTVKRGSGSEPMHVRTRVTQLLKAGPSR